ncbi:hypothetical protein MNV_1080015 [Candidatus Methanoperedens nitroreducens]|uniref:Uncharacterized protein n=1 Tax=Candidatus Methanoperedens nitratireducens TaxID=1392998 RepID=A0A284VIR7_9EURY|nr:hypothetical protein MNV_1080015 [Candidatus Methanoperedens nitroreducens]
MPLPEIIIQKIRQTGPISFRDFMEMALYYPELGYYNSQKDRIGKQGDYYTSSNVTSIFGEMLGRQLEEMWQIIGEKEITIVEMGAGVGLLSQDVLGYLKKTGNYTTNLITASSKKARRCKNNRKRDWAMRYGGAIPCRSFQE